MTALDVLAVLTGKSAAELLDQAERYVESGRVREVPDSAEFRRIRDLPRRSLDSGEELVDKLTTALSQPWGTMRLRPIQALALAEIFQRGGLFGPIRVGAGKTLVSYLAPVMARSQVPLFVVPASLKDKTLREFEALHQHWRGPPPASLRGRIVSYELLGRPQAGSTDNSGTMLDKLMPDLIVFDECHKIKNHSAAVTKRVRRYLAKHPECKVIAMSGTVTKRSLKDYAHIAHWCLKDSTPVPTTWQDLEHWSAALDEKIQDFARVEPGALTAFADGPGLEAVRVGYRKRLVETPGVVATQDGPLDMSLVITAREPESHDHAIDSAFHRLRTMWETPDAHPIADPLAFRRHAFELALGFHYRWVPPAPPEWLEARSVWSKACREVLKNNRRGLDSEAQVVLAVDQGQYPHLVEPLRRWRAVKPTFDPNPVAHWHSDEAIEAAASWRHSGIIWVSHSAFGLRLSEVTGWPYYRQGGLAADGSSIEDHRKGTLIASIKSNGTGRNLQRWHKNLVMSPPSDGEVWEQLLGRTHRDGQTADTVDVEVYLSCVEHAVAFEQARADSLYQQSTTGQSQKLLYADCDYPALDSVSLRTGDRWTR